jgi:hypothetical protein
MGVSQFGQCTCGVGVVLGCLVSTGGCALSDELLGACRWGRRWELKQRLSIERPWGAPAHEEGSKANR